MIGSSTHGRRPSPPPTRTRPRSASDVASSPPTRFYEWTSKDKLTAEEKRSQDRGGHRASPTSCTAATASRWPSRACGRSGATRRSPTVTHPTPGCARARSSRRAPTTCVVPIHDRMPVMLAEPTWDEWLDPANTDLAALQSLLVPAPDDWLEVYPGQHARQQARQQRREPDRTGRSLIPPADRGADA